MYLLLETDFSAQDEKGQCLPPTAGTWKYATWWWLSKQQVITVEKPKDLLPLGRSLEAEAANERLNNCNYTVEYTLAWNNISPPSWCPLVLYICHTEQFQVLAQSKPPNRGAVACHETSSSCLKPICLNWSSSAKKSGLKDMRLIANYKKCLVIIIAAHRGVTSC